MSAPRPQSKYGEQTIDGLIDELIKQLPHGSNSDLIRSLIVTSLNLSSPDIDRLDAKIANQSLVEIRNAAQVFSSHKENAKVTIFGSARTKPEHPDYQLAKKFAQIMSERNWMTITGAGPGIMEAGIEGAGRENSFGVNIELPFEQEANSAIYGDPKLATFKYFFTRKLTFMKETDAFALFPGGFGTLDETFELLTLIQTGKSYPCPIVMVDHPGSDYWSSLQSFIDAQLLEAGLVGEFDRKLYLWTHDASEAAEFVSSFYSCYHSLRYVGDKLVIRLTSQISEADLQVLNGEFGSIVSRGQIEFSEATSIEKKSNDNPELPRLSFKFDNKSFSSLVALIWRINDLAGHHGAQATPGLVHDVDPLANI